MAGVLALALAGCATTRNETPTSVAVTQATNPARPASVTPTTISDPWRAYWTSVDPGSGIDFVTTQDGWRVDGQVWGPRIDDNLGSAVADNGSAWPGTSLSATDNGGRTWQTIFRLRTGIWGLDRVSERLGFAVGVTALWQTADGGKRWRRRGEPAGHALVWVDFTSARRGYGLTTAGALMQSDNGGTTWTPVAGRQTKETAACFSSARVGYVVDSSGALYRSRDGGASWSIVERAPRPVEGFIGPWSELSCDGSNVWLGLQLSCAAACGGASPYRVEHSADGGATWSTRQGGWPRPSPTAPALYLASVAAAGADGGGIVVGLPTENAPPPADDIQLLATTSPVGPYGAATVPTLPPSNLIAATVHVRGVAFVGSTGWLYFDDTAMGTPKRPLAEPIVWKTTDAGRSWYLLASGPKTPPPPSPS